MSIRPYRQLDPQKIVQTADLLQKRIFERFGDAGLQRVAAELHVVSCEAVERSEQIRHPHWGLRLVTVSLCVLVATLLGFVAGQLRLDEQEWQQLTHIEQFIQSFEAAIGSIVFLGAAILYVASLEQRWKRDRALRAIHELRALAHIVDMHQLTKDPESTLQSGTSAVRTPSSPKRELTPFLMGRYLDYCSELLSLVSKIGAVYVQEFPDPIALEAVNDLSDLTNGLTRNIWQKIMILDRAIEHSERSSESLSANAVPGINLVNVNVDAQCAPLDRSETASDLESAIPADSRSTSDQ